MNEVMKKNTILSLLRQYGVVFLALLGLLITSSTQAQTNDAQFISQSLPSSLTPGQTATATVTMKNTGTTTWTAANSYRLGTQNPPDNKTWGFGRVPLTANEAIAPGQQKSFSFTLKAPATEGTYNFQAKMVRDGVAWFGALSTNQAIRVANASSAKLYYLHTDHLDTPRLVTDETNKVVWRNTPLSEPFGIAPVEEDPDGDGVKFVLNLRFPGQYFDRETNTHYNYYRDHYFPDLGRYGQSDPILTT